MVQSWFSFEPTSKKVIKLRVLISDPVTQSGINLLKDAGLSVDYVPKWKNKDLIPFISNAHGWIVRSGTQITENFLKISDKLQIIGRAGVGIDNINLSLATRKGIVVVNTPDVNTISAAEHTVGLILSSARNITLGHMGIKSGCWDRHKLVGVELKGKTLGIVGLGKIGREVMLRCKAFQMNIIGYDPFLDQDMFSTDDIKLVDLDTLTRKSDFITLHLPINEKTKNLYNIERLKMMKPSAHIINVARGGIVNENDLSIALNKSIISGAAIDVFTSEPLDPKHKFTKTKNILLTPHLGASTVEAKEGVSVSICETIRDFLINNKLPAAINIPLSNFENLSIISPFLKLAEKLGKTQAYFTEGVVNSICVECAGNIDDPNPITLSFLKGFLEDRVSERLNFINAEAVATELGITIIKTKSSDTGGYSNILRTSVNSSSGGNEINGTVFDSQKLAFVHFMGYELDIEPRGNILFIKNKDVPGVVGKVGTLLGKGKVNIGLYLLSRKKDGFALGAIRIDSEIPPKIFKSLNDLEEVIFLQQIQY